MMFTPKPPTHYCATCSRPLWDDRWAYAVCRPCSTKPCKHGNTPGECNECDIEGDRAYDAAKGN